MKWKVLVITVSDRSYKGEREDKTGPAIIEFLEKENRFSQIDYELIQDGIIPVREKLLKGIKKGYELIITNGGTGPSKRDLTPEATKLVIEKEIPGIVEEMRRLGLQKTKTASLTRGIAGIVKDSIIINLPGSTKGAIENLTATKEAIYHAIEILKGELKE